MMHHFLYEVAAAVATAAVAAVSARLTFSVLDLLLYSHHSALQGDTQCNALASQSLDVDSALSYRWTVAASPCQHNASACCNAVGAQSALLIIELCAIKCQLLLCWRHAALLLDQVFQLHDGVSGLIVHVQHSGAGTWRIADVQLPDSLQCECAACSDAVATECAAAVCQVDTVAAQQLDCYSVRGVVGHSATAALGRCDEGFRNRV
eukprot:19769-Heterococcus_DN1.PRE.2